MQRWILPAAWLLLMVMTAHTWAADVDLVLAPPPDTARGGDTIFLNLYWYNHGAVEGVVDLPPRLPCIVATERTTVNLEADLLDAGQGGRVTVPGNGFALRRYRLRLPVFAAGSVRITLPTLDNRSLLMDVAPAPPETWQGEQVPLDEGPAMLQSFLDDLSTYEPMYFLLGVDPGLDQSQFQFSFKYRLFNPQGFLAEKAPWVAGFHLGYTQRSIWDLKDDSKPFEDTSYMPEVFYLLPMIDLHVDRVSAFGIQTGFLHESNGKGGDDSRSTNYLYLKPTLGVHLAGPWYLKLAPKIYVYAANEDENNPDLADYWGYVDFELGIMDPEGAALNTHWWWAKEGASMSLDLTYPMTELMGQSLNFYLQAQYFNGYTDTLLRYNERQDAFRLGFAIVR